MVGNFFAAKGGAFQQCVALADRLEKRGHRVLRTSTRRTRTLRLAEMVLTAHRRRHEYEVAVVDVFSGPSFLWAEAVVHLLTLLGKPAVLILRGGGLPQWSEGKPARVQRLLEMAAAVSCPSRFLQDAMQRFRGDILLIPNGIEVSDYPYRRRSPAQPRLVWLRAFHKIYNPNLAVEVFARILPKYRDACLTMIGPDKGDGSLQECVTLAEKLGVAARVHFAGAVPKSQVPRFLEEAVVFLNTTNVDNAPVSVLEALACGLCVVSTNVGGIPYLLEHEGDALLVPPENPGAMAAAVLGLVRDGELAARVSSNGRRKAEGFDWQVVVPLWEETIARAVRQ